MTKSKIQNKSKIQISKLIFLFLITFICATEFIFALDDGLSTAFDKANEFYQQGKHDEAIAEYSKILEGGFESGNLYYNLGNAYFKKNELGKAVLNYERAKRLIPRDKDLESNYAYAKSLMKREVEEPKKIWVLRVIDSFFRQLTVDGLSIFLSVIYILFVITVILTTVLKTSKVKSYVTLAMLAAIFTIGAFEFGDRTALSNKEAVIVQEKIDAKFEPADRATTHFTLYEGNPVRIISDRQGWFKIKRADGKIGWVASDTLEII